jgi:hypothetical protein
LQAIKTLIKGQRKKLKKLKVKGPNSKYLIITFYKLRVKLKTNKTSTKEKMTKKNSNQNSKV